MPLAVATALPARPREHLFFDVARILKDKRPAAFMLENVKNLQSHDKGNTFAVILKTLREETGLSCIFQGD